MPRSRCQLTLSPWLDQPLLIDYDAIFTSVSASVIDTRQLCRRGKRSRGVAALCSLPALPTRLYRVSPDVLKRIPSLFPFLLADLFIYQLSMKCSVPLRFLPSYIALPTSTFSSGQSAQFRRQW